MSLPDTHEPARLMPLELVAGTPLGELRGEEALPDPAPGLTPRAALEEAVAKPLRRPPCLVSFSGGRDSSAVLALATDVARREGLPLPVPTTYRYPGVPEADESSWQELVVRRLRLKDWHRTEVTDQLEVIGPEATAILRRHGVLWPFNAYGHAPLLRQASGGSLLTGFDGDGLFESWRWQRAAAAWGLHEPPRSRDVLRVVLAVAPRRLQTAWLLRQEPAGRRPWLRTHAEMAVRRALAQERAAEPATWDRRVDWYARRRLVGLSRRSLALLAQETGTMLIHPLLDERFLAALARAGGRSGGGSRTAWMRSLFGDLLPEQVLNRTDKADVGPVHWGERTSRFAEDWNGSGVDEKLVSLDALRETWKVRDVRSAMLLQTAWLASIRGQSAGLASTGSYLATER